MRKLGVLSILIVFIVATLACQISGGPKPPRILSISLSESKAFEQALTNVQVNLQTGFVTITLTETQVSSYIAYNLKDDFSKYIRDPMVIFEPNQVHIYGTYMGESIQLDGRIIFEVAVINNTPKLNLISAEFGPIPVPSPILKALTDQLDKEVAKALTKNTTEYLVDTITVATGVLTIGLKKK
jgi:hypothetical protein